MLCSDTKTYLDRLLMLLPIVFFSSEILLTSEAKYITYVNKTGQRSDHYLEDTLLQERADISQRLKYTKDIMHRLITMA